MVILKSIIIIRIILMNKIIIYLFKEIYKTPPKIDIQNFQKYLKKIKIYKVSYNTKLLKMVKNWSKYTIKPKIWKQM